MIAWQVVTHLSLALQSVNYVQQEPIQHPQENHMSLPVKPALQAHIHPSLEHLTAQTALRAPTQHPQENLTRQFVKTALQVPTQHPQENQILLPANPAVQALIHLLLERLKLQPAQTALREPTQHPKADLQSVSSVLQASPHQRHPCSAP